MTTFTGRCQCGAVAFTADLSLDKPITCNCSRCRRLGSVLVFTPQANFTLLHGQDNLTEYLFNKQVIRHSFCKTCGIEGFAMAAAPDGTPMMAVNVNVLEGVDPRDVAARAHHYDGAST